MEKSDFGKYLEERYYKQMEYYSMSSAKNQKKYTQYQWVLIILSALTPVFAALSGLKLEVFKTTPILSIITVIISSTVAVLTTGLKTFNYQELWIKYRSTYEKLKPEIHYYNFNVGPYGEKDIDRESLFVSRIEAILDSEHKEWPPLKKSDDNKG